MGKRHYNDVQRDVDKFLGRGRPEEGPAPIGQMNHTFPLDSSLAVHSTADYNMQDVCKAFLHGTLKETCVLSLLRGHDTVMTKIWGFVPSLPLAKTFQTYLGHCQYSYWKCRHCYTLNKKAANIQYCMACHVDRPKWEAP
jgi:hypothetical protein